MELPELSHQQVLVLECLSTTDVKGRHLRQRLKEKKLIKSGPAFYQMMSRIEESGFVEGWYEQRIVEGQLIKERTYKMTGKGHHALAATLDYYRQRLDLNPGFGGGLANA